MLKSVAIRSFVAFGGISVLHFFFQQPRVVFWHGVGLIQDSEIEAECISEQCFVKQIDYLRRKFDIISADEFFERYQNRKLKGKELLLTFDDGYRNNLICAAPIMQKYSLPFLVFISTGNIEKQLTFETSNSRLILIGSSLKKISLDSIPFSAVLDSRSNRIVAARKLNQFFKELSIENVQLVRKELLSKISKDEMEMLQKKYSTVQPMNWDEVQQLRTMGATIGSHCINHFCCQKSQSLDETKRQIIESKKIIESKINTPCYYFAYPNGDHSPQTDAIVHEAGYRLGFATHTSRFYSTDEDSAALPRIGMLGNYEKSLVWFYLKERLINK